MTPLVYFGCLQHQSAKGLVCLVHSGGECRGLLETPLPWHMTILNVQIRLRGVPFDRDHLDLSFLTLYKNLIFVQQF